MKDISRDKSMEKYKNYILKQRIENYKVTTVIIVAVIDLIISIIPLAFGDTILRYVYGLFIIGLLAYAVVLLIKSEKQKLLLFVLLLSLSLFVSLLNILNAIVNCETHIWIIASTITIIAVSGGTILITKRLIDRGYYSNESISLKADDTIIGVCIASGIAGYFFAEKMDISVAIPILLLLLSVILIAITQTFLRYYYVKKYDLLDYMKTKE